MLILADWTHLRYPLHVILFNCFLTKENCFVYNSSRSPKVDETWALFLDEINKVG
jgi:hypothetical protein